MGLTLKDGRRILDGVTGTVEEGSMVAVMGPSGCGKTTFMNVLCGKATYGDMDGEMKINGEAQDISAFRNDMGFVPQEDIVFEQLTVREQITFSAELRNRSGTPKKKIQNIVEDVLSVLQISHVQNSIA